MKKIVFTEEFCTPENLFPFTLTRQVQDIRIGIFTIREKWELYLGLDSYDKFENDYKDLDRAISKTNDRNRKRSDESRFTISSFSVPCLTGSSGRACWIFPCG